MQQNENNILIYQDDNGITKVTVRFSDEDVCGEGCINETFRVLKDNEIRQYGEYRTKRLVLDAWNRFGYDK